ncbi:class A beta-lactamase-related serine hydrolase [Candidatus Parcubacteria bacterium]|nr:class A beta-lactamase-related serine hydrolase [Candidatus Parcubacteria bacterium]
MNRRNWLLSTIAIGIAAALVGIAADRTLFRNFDQASAQVIATREVDIDGYKFIHPLLTCNVAEVKESPQLDPLKNVITGFINEKINSGDLSEASVYMRVPNGYWLVINENEKYNPASLLKVPVMMAFYKWAENDPSILNKKIYFDGSFDYNKAETYTSTERIKPNHTYTVDQLVDSLIINSDNNAAQLLYTIMDPSELAEVYTDLGLRQPDNNVLSDSITVKSYAYFFRVLFNATYLTRKYSEHALDLLSRSTFPGGLIGGVPKGIIVANKFGERTILNSNNDSDVRQRELHDCGIVYVDNKSYLLCVMTKGKDFSKLNDFIEQVSKQTYNFVKNNLLSGQ